MIHRVNRRRFLQTTAAAGAFGFWSGRLLADDPKPSANERLHVAVIGIAGQGDYDLGETAKTGTAIVGLCDVDENRAAGARRAHPKAKFFTDFREVFDLKGLDAVVIA